MDDRHPHRGNPVRAQNPAYRLTRPANPLPPAETQVGEVNSSQNRQAMFQAASARDVSAAFARASSYAASKPAGTPSRQPMVPAWCPLPTTPPRITPGHTPADRSHPGACRKSGPQS